MGILDSISSFQERRGREAFIAQTRKELDKSFFEKTLAKERLLAQASVNKTRRKDLVTKARKKALFEAKPRSERARIRLENVLSLGRGTGRRVGLGARRAGRGLKRVSSSFARAEKRLSKRSAELGPPLGGSLGDSIFKR